MRYRTLVTSLVAASLPAILDTGAIAQASALAHLASGPSPYWVPEHFLLMYVRAPLAAISAGILFMAPGLLLTLRTKAARTFALWLLAAFLTNLIVVSASAGLVQLAIARPLTGYGFVAVLAACFTGAAVFGWRREQSSDTPADPLRDFPAPSVAALVAPIFLIVAVLAPKFFWENLNNDGAHTFEAVRLLLHGPLPFLPPEAGRYSSYPDLASFLYAYPASWYLRLFGEHEAVVRLPLMLYLTVLACGVVAFAESGKARLPLRSRWMVWLGIITFLTTVAYSATYSVYAADLAKPGGQDSLLMALVIAHIVFFIEDRALWSVLALTMAYAVLPTASVVMMFWLIGAFVAKAGTKRGLAICAAALIACVVLDGLVARLVLFNGEGRPRPESLIWYFTYLQFTHWQRILYVLVPAGILPFLSLLAWKRLDAPGRAMAFAAVAFFILAYIQSQTALHHFIPAMLLPLAVFWRLANSAATQRGYAFPVAVVASALMAFTLSLPRSFHLFVEAGATGSLIDDRFPQNRLNPPGYAGLPILATMFSEPGEKRRNEAAVSPLTLRFYSHRRPARAVPPAYVLQSPGTAAPQASTIVASDSEAVLYALSDSIWKKHRAMRPVAETGSPIYRIPPQSRLRNRTLRDHPENFSVLRGLASAGVDTAALRARGWWH